MDKSCSATNRVTVRASGFASETAIVTTTYNVLTIP
jgi:hypothetical protein